MTTIRGFIKSHSLLSYFALVFAISWGGALIVAGPGAFLGTRERSGVLFLSVVLIYDRTESLLVAMLMHVSLSASLFILTPLTISGVAILTYVLVWAAALWVVVGAVALANHGHLTRRPALRRRVA